ncbi:MAG: site-2 protease family protein [Bacillaceae bacterium]|nr:site-2 protease family protein [Bacillaceae bacterium]
MTSGKQQRKKWGSLGGLGALLFMLGSKLKFLIPLLKLGKFGGTIWSMVIMVGAYALIYPWSFSLGVVLMIFIHEMGHIWAARRKGLPVSAPAFIPFVGALITMKKQPSNAETEAYVALGGPVMGSLGALMALGLALWSRYEVFYVIAQVGFFLNLINLLPIHPLDGGRIVTAISRWLWVVGLLGGLLIIIYLKFFILLLIWMLFVWELYNRYIRKPGQKNQKVEEVYTFSRELDTGIENGFILPGESHTRQLPFTLYCRLEDRAERCQIWYPGIGSLGDIPVEKGRVEQVRLTRTRIEEGRIHFEVNVSLMLHPEYVSGAIREEGYYQVSARTRIKYGLLYFGLALFLIWMMMVTGRLITRPYMIG